MLRSLLLCVGVAAVGAFSPQVLLTRPVGVLPESRICSHQKFGRSGALRLVSQTSPTEVAEIKQAEKKRIPDFDVEIPAPKEGDYLDQFCRGTNNLMKQLVLPSVRERVELQRAGTADKDIMSRLLAKPEYPPMSRPLWLVMAGSIPTALGWYGFYKFSVEEELFQEELRTEGRVTGCGGYGTLFPFVYLGLFGAVGKFILDIPNSEILLQAAGAWILGGQINLYYRINQKFIKKGQEPPLHAWWAVLPHPFDLIVGLRQVHFLARHYSEVRGEEWESDKVAEELFPFISSSRFTLKEFVLTPSNWFWFTKDMKDFDLPNLK